MQDLIIERLPPGENPVMVLGLTGWMDGGRVSTGTIGYLGERLEATAFGEIQSDDFYIFNFPVSTLPITVYLEGGRAVVAPVNPMESAAVFRPHTEIEDGVTKYVRMPRNRFWHSPSARMVLFSGEEPHIRWGSFCDCIFEVARQAQVQRMIFVGSVAGPVPHTREPRVRASLSDAARRPELEACGVSFTDYEGPSSIINSLSLQAPSMGIEFTSLVVDIPHYPFVEMPTYPRSILRMVSLVGQLLDLELDLEDLRQADEAVRGKLDAVMDESAEFRELVAKLEEAYDLEQSGDEELLRQLIESIDLEGNGEDD